MHPSVTTKGRAPGVGGIHGRRLKGRSRPLAAVVVPGPPGADSPAGLVDIRLRPVQDPLRLLLAGDGEGGHVVVHHGDGELGGQRHALFRQQLGELVRRAAGPLAAGHHQIDILLLVSLQLELVQEKAEDAGQALEVDRRHKADPLVPAHAEAVAAGADRVPQGDQPVLRDSGDALSSVLAVAGGGKIKDHGIKTSFPYDIKRGWGASPGALTRPRGSPGTGPAPSSPAGPPPPPACPPGRSRRTTCPPWTASAPGPCPWRACP